MSFEFHTPNFLLERKYVTLAFLIYIFLNKNIIKPCTILEVIFLIFSPVAVISVLCLIQVSKRVQATN